jgi:hypothetical protein
MDKACGKVRNGFMKSRSDLNLLEVQSLIPGQQSTYAKPGMSNFKQVVIDFLVSKLPVIYHPLLSPYLALSKNISKNNTTHDVCCKSNIH